MFSICEKNPMATKLKHAEEYLDSTFVSQILKESSFY